ncbi:hypothetical protein Tco_0716204 [Tanacetum coccineum]
MGYFARECRGPRNQNSRNRNQDSSRRTVNVKETSSKSMVAINGAGFGWSYMADEEVPTNMALMAFSDSKARKIYIELGSTSGIRACRETLNDDIPPPPPPPQTQTPTQQAPHTVSTIKLPILKKGEYDIWAMKMEHYLAHTDYPIWEVIQRGNGLVSVSTDTNGVIKVLPPKTSEEILARERERKARTTLLMGLLEDHLAKFHKMTDAKEMWEAIKSRFGGNDESKKMQKYILKQQFKCFSVSNLEGLHKGYDRTKPGVDSLSFDDLYNNLRVFESNVKGSSASSSSTQNVAFVSENTCSTNKVSTAYGASSSSGHNPQREGSSLYTNELMYPFFANQSSGPQLDHVDLEQLDEFDLEEMDLKWHFARECRSKGNQDSRRRDAWNTGNKAKDNERRSGKQEEPKALVTIDGDGVDWTSHSEDEQENYALMAYKNSGSDTEEKIRFMKIDLDDKTDVLTYHKKLLAEAKKEKEELNAKVEKWHNSSKSLNILLNSQMSARDKAPLGYGDQMNKGVLSYENEVFERLFYSRSSDIEDSPMNDRYAKGMHAVPPPMTGIYILSGPDKEIDESQFTYGPKQSKPSESDARSSNFNSCKSNSSEETLESMPELVVNEPKVVSQPKVWSDAPIIEEYESDSDDEHLKNVLVPLDHFPINALTSKVLSFMVKKGKNFSGNATPLFDSMLVQPTEDEDLVLQSLFLISIQQVLVGIIEVTIQAKEIKDLKAKIKKLKKKARHVITHHKAWMKSVSMKTRFAGKKSMQKKWMQKEFVSKQGRKTAKSKPTAHKDQPFDDLDDFDAMDYIKTEDAHNEKGVPPSQMKFLVSMSQNKAKQKGVEIKDAEDSDRPRPTSTRSLLTLKPLPKIDPKDKGKKVLEEEAESNVESEGVNEAERKFAQLANDEEIARKVQEE